MKELMNKCKGYLDYLPLMLITLLFIAETELEHHAVHMSCQIAITIITLSIFFIVVINIKDSKVLGFTVALTVWIILIYIKNRCLLKKRV